MKKGYVLLSVTAVALSLFASGCSNTKGTIDSFVPSDVALVVSAPKSAPVSLVQSEAHYGVVKKVDAGDVDSVQLNYTHCGSRIEKTKKDQFEFDYLNVDHPDNFKLATEVRKGILSIHADGGKTNITNTNSGKEHNAVLIKVPDKQYGGVNITSDGGGLTFCELRSNINISADSGMVTLNVSPSQITKNITIEGRNGKLLESRVFVNFEKTPENLELICPQNGDVVLPDGWKGKTRFGKGKPCLTIRNDSGIFINVKNDG